MPTLSKPTLCTYLLASLFFIVAFSWITHFLAAPFHEDEAIYAAWSLAILRGDFWLSETPIDKPPLTFYPMALSMALTSCVSTSFGKSEWAARLPSLFWMGLLLVSLWRIATQFGRSGWVAIVGALCSPLVWTYATSAFTDSAMVALTFFALERALRGQSIQAGLAFGGALLAKPTALFLAPLLLSPQTSPPPQPLSQYWERGANASHPQGARKQPAWYYFLMASAVPLLLAWAWDASREAISWWALGGQAYGTLGEPQFLVGAWLRLTLLSFAPLLPLLLVRTRARTNTPFPALRATLLLWLPLHMLLGFQPWERYLLPLVPLAALSLAFYTSPRWSIHALPILKHVQRNEVKASCVSPFLWILLLLLPPTLVEPYTLEPHDGRWEGIAEIGIAIEELPSEAHVYYHETGRPLAWYASDAKATLIWAGNEWEYLPAPSRTQDKPYNTTSDTPIYAIIRTTNTRPSTLATWHVVVQNNNFALLALAGGK